PFIIPYFLHGRQSVEYGSGTGFPTATMDNGFFADFNGLLLPINIIGTQDDIDRSNTRIPGEKFYTMSHQGHTEQGQVLFGDISTHAAARAGSRNQDMKFSHA